MENKSERWKAVRSDLIAKNSLIFCLPILKKANRRNCNGLTDSSTLQIANDPRIKLMIPEQSSDQDGLRK